ncbi:ABC transporter ATP-binding protein [Kamptonema cortianum]|nr:ABC transporter ATP-binding protein [Geitlerinema splendidum]MDK3155952.1 ABC transporter ATP-binding protein [Kamptonema cortianum]
MPENILSVEDAHVRFPVHGGEIWALDGVSIALKRGECLAVVGESGCGKTTLARAVLGLQPMSQGSITLNGKPVEQPGPGLAQRVGIIWQDPFASIEPLWKIRRILEEPFRLAKTEGSIDELMQLVGLDAKLADRYPHQLSGGQRQRVAIGRAIALKPPLVICDEPTAALDLSIQAQILNLLKDLQSTLHCSYLYISHDLLTVRFVADRIAVMYMGQIVESGETEEVFTHPRHPYTKALLASAPSLETLGKIAAPARGEIPDPKIEFKGCKFASRCPIVQEVCREGLPNLSIHNDHSALCNFPDRPIEGTEQTDILRPIG